MPEDSERIDRLLELIAADWKRTVPEQGFFQYAAGLAGRLGTEDSELIELLAGGELPGAGDDGSRATEHLLSSPANAARLRGSIRQHRLGRTPAQKAAIERLVKIEAAKLRCELDQQLGRETPTWVVDLANEAGPFEAGE